MSSNVFQRGLSRISRRKKKTRALPVIQETEHPTEQEVPDMNLPAKPSLLGRGMDRLRRSIRQSFRRKKSPERLPAAELVGNTSTSSSSKHDQWQPDEGAVRAGLCSFNVKYLGAVEVFEARGMQVCEGALKMLRNTRRRPVKAVLYVSGDGLRVVDQQNNRGLIVDQTIEKVSFCAPDRNNDKGFAYICRDGTSRRWMCHGFSSSKDSGERLSHAVGCAFAICLERKKKRDEESTVSVEKALHPDWGQAPSTAGTAAASSSSNATMSDSDSGSHRANPAYQSFRKQISIKDRLQDPQSAIVNECPQRAVASTSSIAKPRPAPNPALFQRQGSLRAPDSSNTAQFRRNLSLRSNSLENTGKTQRVPFGQMMHNEPIYEGDEAETTETVHPTSLTAPSTMSHSLYGTLSSNFSPPDANTTSSFNNGVSSSTSNNLISTTSASNSQSSQWSTFDSSGGKVGSGGVTTNQLINVDTQMNGATPCQSSSSRNKADEWLNGALQTSLSFSSPPQTAQVTPTFSGHALPGGTAQPTAGTNPAPSPYSLLDGSLLSGPPPSYAPPPLPTKQAVANGNTNTPFTSSPSPQPVDMFGQAVQWDTVPAPLPPKPVDPFDVQWSRLAISGNNPFASEHTSSGREVSI